MSNKTMKKIIFLIIMLLIPISVGKTQVPFVLVTLQSGDYFIYEDMSNNNSIRFNVTDQSIYGSENSAIFVNTLESNSSKLLGIINENNTLTNGNYTLTFLNVLNSTYNYSAKGNFLVSGFEWRNARFENITHILFEKATKINVKFDIGDRAITILTENIVIDSLHVTINSNDTQTEQAFFSSFINYKVTYLPSDMFNFTYKDETVFAKNITEKFSYQSSSFTYTDSSGNNSIELYFSLNDFTNEYICALGFALPLFLVKRSLFNSTENDFLLYEYSNERDFYDVDSFNLLFVFIVFSVIIFRRKRNCL